MCGLIFQNQVRAMPSRLTGLLDNESLMSSGPSTFTSVCLSWIVKGYKPFFWPRWGSGNVSSFADVFSMTWEWQVFTSHLSIKSGHGLVSRKACLTTHLMMICLLHDMLQILVLFFQSPIQKMCEWQTQQLRILLWSILFSVSLFGLGWLNQTKGGEDDVNPACYSFK